MFEPISRVLKKSLNSVRLDQKIFNEYSKGKMSLETCMEMFFRNNNVKDDARALITEDLFKAWLYTEGYGMRDGL